MLKTRYIKIQVTDLDNDRYFISAFDENERNYAPSTWQYLLFNYHKESFYGTMTETCQNRWHTRSNLKRLAARDPFRPRSI